MCFCLLLSIYLFLTTKTELWTFTWPPKAVRLLYMEIHLIAFKLPSTVDCIAIWFVVGSPSYYLHVACTFNVWACAVKIVFLVGSFCELQVHVQGMLWDHTWFLHAYNESKKFFTNKNHASRVSEKKTTQTRWPSDNSTYVYNAVQYYNPTSPWTVSCTCVINMAHACVPFLMLECQVLPSNHCYRIIIYSNGTFACWAGLQ